MIIFDIFLYISLSLFKHRRYVKIILLFNIALQKIIK